MTIEEPKKGVETPHAKFTSLVQQNDAAELTHLHLHKHRTDMMYVYMSLNMSGSEAPPAKHQPLRCRA